MAETFMQAVLGNSSRIEVSIAWGANLLAAASTWTWTDITNKVFVDKGVNVTIGRADEASASQPAQCSFTVDNSDAGFSLGGLSPNWPNVKRDTPIRVRVDPNGAGFIQVFLGYADGFNPSFNLAGNVATVIVSASGVLRRLAQNTQPSTSAIRRGIRNLPNLVAYWPLEDGKLSTSPASALPGGSDMKNNVGVPNFAASTDFICSAPLPTLNNAWLGGQVQSYTASTTHQVRFLLYVPAADTANEAPLATIFTTGSANVWDLIWVAGAVNNIRLIVRSTTGAAGHGGEVQLWNQQYGFGIRGLLGQMSLQTTESGGNVQWFISHMEAKDGTPAGGVGNTLTGQTFGRITGILLNGGGFHQNVVIGHVSAENAINSVYTNGQEILGHLGDKTWDVGGRLARVCTQNGITLDVDSTSATVNNDFTDRMGPQPISILLPVLREVEVTDQGMMHDGVTQGLKFMARRRIEDQAPLFTVDARDLVTGGPVADDQGITNRVRVQQSGGTTSDAEDVSGPMGTNTIGVYDSSATVSLYKTFAPLQYANWLLRKGTVEGYRYPQLGINVGGARNPKTLAASLLGLLPGVRLDVLGFRNILPQHPDGTVQLLVQGYTHTFTSTRWTTTINVSPYEAWHVVKLAAATGDTDENLLHLDTDGCTLTSLVAKGATSLSLTTASGPLWTTVADDFPFDMEVGGVKVTVTTITGASSPQTATVVGATVTKALAAGSAVKVWKPPALAL